MLRFEHHWQKRGKNAIAGIDEVGRGPLAGPVVACAVILPNDVDIEGINDSKKLSEKKRNSLFLRLIGCDDIKVGIGIVSERIIDDINILQAAKLAMCEAVNNLLVSPDHLLIDGLFLDKLPGVTQTKIIKGDSLSLSIASASIIAKVIRDAMMVEFDSVYPGYKFAKHKGYGTKDHIGALKELGVTRIHRKSFAPVSGLSS